MFEVVATQSPRLRRWLVGLLATLSCTIVVPPASAQAPTTLPADLDLIPRDAVAFFHFRAKDIWQSDWMKDARYLIEKAGPQAWKEFERHSPIAPSTIDRITLVMLNQQAFNHPFPGVDPEAMSALVVIHTTVPYDRLALLQAANSREKAYRRNLYYFNEDLWSGLVMVDERTFLVGSEDAVVRWFEMSRTRTTTSPLQSALLEAAGKHQLVFGWNPTAMVKEAQGMPPPVTTLMEAHCCTAVVDVDKGLKINVKFDYQKAEQAQAGEKALRDTLELGRQGLAQPIGELERRLKDKAEGIGELPEAFAMLVGLGFLREADSMLKDAAIERQGTSVRVPLSLQKFDAGNNMMVISLMGIQYVGRSANMAFGQVGAVVGGGNARDPMETHLRNLVQGMEKYHTDKGSYPAAATYDQDGRPVLSWRVALLPYLGDEAKALHAEFRLNEPWDSLHNKKLIKRMPKALQGPDNYQWGQTRWKSRDQIFTGADTFFDGKKGPAKETVTGKTILLAHTVNDRAVYWTKPADLAYRADEPLAKLFGRYENQFSVLLADGTCQKFNSATDEKELRALIQRRKDK